MTVDTFASPFYATINYYASGANMVSGDIVRR